MVRQFRPDLIGISRIADAGVLGKDGKISRNSDKQMPRCICILGRISNLGRLCRLDRG